MSCSGQPAYPYTGCKTGDFKALPDQPAELSKTMDPGKPHTFYVSENPTQATPEPAFPASRRGNVPHAEAHHIFSATLSFGSSSPHESQVVGPIQQHQQRSRRRGTHATGLWRSTCRRQAAEVRAAVGEAGGGRIACVHPSQPLLAVAQADGGGSGGATLLEYDLTTGARLAAMKLPQPPVQLIYDPRHCPPTLLIVFQVSVSATSRATESVSQLMGVGSSAGVCFTTPKNCPANGAEFVETKELRKRYRALRESFH